MLTFEAKAEQSAWLALSACSPRLVRSLKSCMIFARRLNTVSQNFLNSGFVSWKIFLFLSSSYGKLLIRRSLRCASRPCMIRWVLSRSMSPSWWVVLVMVGVSGLGGGVDCILFQDGVPGCKCYYTVSP